MAASPGVNVPKATNGERARAWAVHAFTMSGVVWACLALLSLADQYVKMMWLWLAIALVVDGIDGTLARKARVNQVVPWFDGVILDDIVDYLTWTFIPAIFMYLWIPMGPKPLAMFLLVVICTSSMFCYCNTGMKSTDYYFVGFPAAWNIVAVHLWVLGTPAWFNVPLVLIFAGLTVAPITFVHPFRVKRMMLANIVATAIWIVTTVALVAMQPQPPVLAYLVWLSAGIWLMAMSAWRTWQGRPDH